MLAPSFSVLCLQGSPLWLPRQPHLLENVSSPGQTCLVCSSVYLSHPLLCPQSLNRAWHVVSAVDGSNTSVTLMVGNIHGYYNKMTPTT